MRYLIIILLLIHPQNIIQAQSKTKSFLGMVSAATPEAASAGKKILQMGGNAVDASIAVSFALAVTEPAGSGIFGQTFMIIHHKKPIVIHGTTYSPGKIPDKISAQQISDRRATTIPSTLKVLEYAWKNYGSGKISWSELVVPAIHYAETGFHIGPFRHLSLHYSLAKLQSYPITAKLFLNKDGSVPQIGTLFKQPLLAKTLKRIAFHGADDFYRGKIAQEIAKDMQINNGWITFEDLKNFPSPKVVSPLTGTYRGWNVYTLPPPTGGWVVLQMLNALEQIEFQQLTGPKRLIYLAQALQVGHQNRHKHPIKNFTNYRQEVSSKISKDKIKKLSTTLKSKDSGETTHFSVVDNKGTVVGVTASINSYFGAKVIHPTLGFLYNDYMKEFVLKENHPYALRPGAMPYSSMSATILAKNGKAHMVVGSPGSSRIISAVVQVIHNWVDNKDPIDLAVAASRIHVVPKNKLYLEKEYQQIKTINWKQYGFSIKNPHRKLARGKFNPYFGGVHALALQDSLWAGGADPRRDGIVTTAYFSGK